MINLLSQPPNNLRFSFGENSILTNAKFDGGSVMRVMTISDDGSTDTNRTNRKTNGMMHIKHDNNICNLNISKFGVGK